MREDLIKQALDANMAGLTVTAADERAILDRVWESPTPKRRFSAVLALTLLLVMVTVGAVAAALLSGKDFAKQIVAPMASQNESESFTAQEVEEILRKAEESGIEIPQYLRDHWAKWGSEYKEELMRALVKTELGFYPGSWSLEDQHWYNSLLVECGLSDKVTNLLPGESDYTQQEVLDKANALFKEKLNMPGDPSDATRYLRFMTFGLDDDSAYRTHKRWTVSYEDLTTGTEYRFQMLDNGLVVMLEAYTPNPFTFVSGLSRAEILASFRAVYGQSILDWPLEALEVFYHATAAAQGEEITDPGARAVSCTRYVLPGKIYTYMTVEEAIDIAREACGAENELEAYWVYIGDDPSNMHWKISFYEPDGWKGTGRLFKCFAQIDGKTGEVEYKGTCEDWPWYAPLVLTQAMENADSPAKPRSYTRPVCWGSQLLPDAYWEKLNALDFRAETKDALIAQWNQTYGDKWPDECYAAYWWWEFDPLMESKNYVIPAWPMEGDLTAEEALQIATEAFMPEAAKIFSDEALAHTYPLKPSIHFKGDDGDYSKRYWVVDFQTDWGTGNQYTDNLVTLDARTGEVLEMELSSQQGNG